MGKGLLAKLTRLGVQHRLKRETPNLQRARMLINDCGWKGGDSGSQVIDALEARRPVSVKKFFDSKFFSCLLDMILPLPLLEDDCGRL
jgi:hypothetical protein